MRAAAGGWVALVRLSLRTARLRLVLWPVGIAVLVGATASSMTTIAASAAQRAAYATAALSTAGLAFNGRGYGLDTVGGITANKLSFLVTLLLPLVAVHLAVHLTRRQEADGLVELVTARAVGRLAPLAAAVVVMCGVVLLAGAGSAVGLVVAGLPAGGSTWYAAGLMGTMAMGAGLGFCAAQVARDGRGAQELGVAVLGALFLVRALVDVRDWPATWLTPGGWLNEVRAFGDARWWPLVALLGCGVVLTGAAVVLNARRDLGAGLISPSAGAPAAGARLATPLGLMVRLTRGSALGWAIGAAVWGFTVGVLSHQVGGLFRANPDLAARLGPLGARVELVMAAVGASYLGLVASALLALELSRVATEELQGRTGVVLATAVGRRAVWFRWLCVAVVWVLLLQVVSGLALGIGVAVGGGSASDAFSGPGWVLAFAPAVLVLGAVSACVVAVAPRPGIAAAWGLFGAVIVIAVLGEVLDLPWWISGLSPFKHVGAVPAESVQWAWLGGMLAVAGILGGVSGLLFSRRDLTA
ncbi:MAG: hypothetical protein U0Y82_00450 [Thermoleophilia bacterium]